MLRTPFIVGTSLALVLAGILGAGRLADLVPAAALVVCLLVLAVMAFIGLVAS